MITLTLSRAGGLYGPAVSASIERLQAALQAYARVTGQPAADPGRVDGILGPKTISAIEIVLPRLGGKLDSSLTTPLAIALPLAAINDDAAAKAQDLITRIAPELTAAIMGLTVSSTTTAVPLPSTSLPMPNTIPTTMPMPMPMMPAVAWYQTTWGIAALAVGAVGLVGLVALLVRK